MAHEAGKGDAQRPTDHKAYSDNYDLIWGKKNDKTTDRPVSTVQEGTTQPTTEGDSHDTSRVQ